MDDIHQSIKCPVCLHPFDADKRIPKISPICGHTVCKDCLIQVLQMDRPRCPLDKLIFDSAFRSIEAFPTNFLGKDLLEMEGKWSRCTSHQEQNKMICLNENTLVCTNCVIFGAHKGHDVKLLSDFKDLANQKKDQLSNVYDKVSTSFAQMSSSFEEKKAKMRTSIKERFESLRSIINKQESQVLLKFEAMFAEEKTKLENMLSSKSSNLATDVKKKMEQFYDIMSNPEITKLLDEDFTELERKVNEEVSLKTSKHTEGLSDLLNILQNSLPNEGLLKDFDVIDDLNKKLKEFKEKRKFDFDEQAQLIQKHVTPAVELEISYQSNGDVLSIEESHRLAKSYTFTRSHLEKVTKLKYYFSSEETNFEERIFPALLWLSKFLPNLKVVEFGTGSSHSCREISETRFQTVLSTFLSKPENLEEMNFDVSNSQVGDLGLIYLAEDVLPKVKNLKSFSCVLYKAQTSSCVLNAFSQINFGALPNLEKFRLNVAGASLEEEDIIKFLNVIPNVKDLLLGFGKTVLNDQCLEAFSTNILPSLDKLERFELGFWDTKLTGTGIQKFLMNLPSLRRLLIGMDRLEIADDVIQTFLDSKLPLMTKLEELNLGFSGVNISNNILRQLHHWKEKIIYDNQVSEDVFPFVQMNPSEL